MASSSAAALKDYAPAAATLFNNMKTPATILAGAIIPLGFSSPLPQPPARIAAVVSGKGNKKEETALAMVITKNLDRMLRKSYLLVTVFSFGSELLAVIWATGTRRQSIFCSVDTNADLFTTKSILYADQVTN